MINCEKKNKGSLSDGRTDRQHQLLLQTDTIQQNGKPLQCDKIPKKKNKKVITLSETLLMKSCGYACDQNSLICYKTKNNVVCDISVGVFVGNRYMLH